MLFRPTNPRAFLVVGMITLLSAVSAQAGEAEKLGRVEFDFADAPPATVEIDLTSETLSTLTGIAKAAVEGVAEGLGESSDAPAVRQSTDHLNAVKEILEVASQGIQEVRVRVYEDLAEHDTAIVEHYQRKLAESSWKKVIRVQDGDERVVVCVQQEASAFRGVFVMVLRTDAGARETAHGAGHQNRHEVWLGRCDRRSDAGDFPREPLSYDLYSHWRRRPATLISQSSIALPALLQSCSGFTGPAIQKATSWLVAFLFFARDSGGRASMARVLRCDGMYVSANVTPCP